MIFRGQVESSLSPVMLLILPKIRPTNKRSHAKTPTCRGFFLVRSYQWAAEGDRPHAIGSREPLVRAPDLCLPTDYAMQTRRVRRRVRGRRPHRGVRGVVSPGNMLVVRPIRWRS